MEALRVQGPAVEPVSLAEAKAHLRIDGTDEDAFLADAIAAARERVEGATRRTLIATTWRFTLDRWPPDRAVALPVSPVLALEAIRVADGSGLLVAAPTDGCRIDRSGDPVRLRIGAALPEPATADGGIVVDVSAGYGQTAGAVPGPLRLAIRRLVADAYARRGDDPPEGRDPLPPDVRGLLLPYCRPRLA